jgi:hypothetical protein
VTNERSIVTSIITRIAIDVSMLDFFHVKTDPETGAFLEIIDSGLNSCLRLEANIDQSSLEFMQDLVETLCQGDGVLAIVPTDTTLNPNVTGSYDVTTMRVGRIVQWKPQDVDVVVYDDEDGRHKTLLNMSKQIVAIVQNPLYQVMNQPNSTLQRLVRKLNLLDVVDEKAGSGKLDILIQLPYTIRTEAKADQAEKRRKQIEAQMQNSVYGIAYIDAAEHVTQLNRPAENNMLAQVEYLTKMLYGQLGMTEEVINGTADEATMLNYHNRTVDPIAQAIALAMKRRFLTKTGRTQGQSIEVFRDPFKYATLSQVAEATDKFSRNEVLTSNEIRGKIGMRPSSEKSANKLANPNMPQTPAVGANPKLAIEAPKQQPVELKQVKKGELQNGT